MKKYIHPAWKALLQKNRLLEWGDIWAIEKPWFCEPNITSTGFSGLITLTIQNRTLFIKKQKNYFKKTLLHPFVGKSVAAQELQKLLFCQKAGIACPSPIYFERKANHAVLITEGLDEYISLDQKIEHWSQEKNIQEKRKTLKSIAYFLRKLHRKKILHRNLYPKHIFIHREHPENICLIDLERLQKRYFCFSPFRDFDTLNRRTKGISKTDRLRFVLDYHGSTRVTPAIKRFIGNIVKKS